MNFEEVKQRRNELFIGPKTAEKLIDWLITKLEATERERKECERQYQEQINNVAQHLAELDNIRAELEVEKQARKDAESAASDMSSDITFLGAENLLLREALENIRDKYAQYGDTNPYLLACEALSNLPDRTTKLMELVEAAIERFELHRTLGPGDSCECELCQAVRAYKEVE